MAKVGDVEVDEEDNLRQELISYPYENKSSPKFLNSHPEGDENDDEAPFTGYHERPSLQPESQGDNLF